MNTSEHLSPSAGMKLPSVASVFMSRIRVVNASEEDDSLVSDIVCHRGMESTRRTRRIRTSASDVGPHTGLEHLCVRAVILV